LLSARHQSDDRRRRLLRARSERPRASGAAEQRYELAPLHRADPKPKDHGEYSRSRQCTAAKAACSSPLWVKSGHRIGATSCPFYPQKRTSVKCFAMYALCQKRTYAAQQKKLRKKLFSCSLLISMAAMTDMAAVDFARRTVPIWQAALGSELLGVYLIGSLAHGGFSRRYSDIDMAVVTQAGLSPQTLDRVRSKATAVSADWSEAFRVLDRPTFQVGPISSARSR